MKRKSLVLGFGFFCFLFLGISIPVYAGIPPQPAPVVTNVSYSGNCQQPASQTFYDQNATWPSTVPWYGTKYWQQYDWTYNATTNTWVKNATPTSQSSSYSTTCSVVSSPSSGSPSSGLVTTTVTWSAGSTYGGDTNQTYYAYFVTKAQVTIAANTREDQMPAIPQCTKWYGTSQSDHASDCYGSLSPNNYSSGSTSASICYTYTDSVNSGVTSTACTTSHFVTGVSITGNTSAYPATPYPYTCIASFSDGTTKDVSSNAYVWSSTKTSGTSFSNTNFIGSNRFVYTDLRGQQYGNNMYSYNDFYAPDPTGGTYTLTCQYIPKTMETAYYFDKTSDSSQSSGKSNTFSLTLLAILRIDIKVDSQFIQNDGSVITKALYLPDTTHCNPWPGDTLCYETWNIDFITGHWYDFRAFATYSDNSVIEISTKNEIYWKTYPWYTSTSTYSPSYGYDTKMAQTDTCSGCGFDGRSGFEHRIPQDGYNMIKVSYLDNFENGYSVSTHTTGQTVQKTVLWSHQMTSLDIRGSGSSYSTSPITSVSIPPSSITSYYAWMTWSDEGTNPFGRGQKGNWTAFVNWQGDDQVQAGNPAYAGQYNFGLRRGSDKRTVSAIFNPIDTFPVHWGYLYDKILVSVNDTCDYGTPATQILIFGCNPPTANQVWQRHLLKNNNINFEPSYPGITYNPDTNDPYHFSYKFDVTGISGGVGAQ